ncbi:MAG: cytochrome C oxidase subunit IV family protein [Pseudobacteriovorax sp.]|nr:cytochrome C oxidase subunit IV family protein [Pseudobacteriovorax sp.]
MSDSHASHGGGVKLYWIFCVILSVITFLEWAVFEYREPWGIGKVSLVVSLSIFSLIKFVMVVGWYMHLKDDPKMLKNTFIFSLLLASGVAAGLLALML